MPLGPPCRDHAPLDSRRVGVDQRDLNSIDEADRIYSNLAVIEPIIHPFQRGSFEDPHGILERKAMKPEIPGGPSSDPTCRSLLHIYITYLLREKCN